MSKKLLVECPRCAHQQEVERAQRFRDEDYYELWHEYAELEQRNQHLNDELAEAQADVERLRFLVARLEVPIVEPEILEADDESPFA